MAGPLRTVSFNLPEELNERLTRLAQARQISRSALAREALEVLFNSEDYSVLAVAGGLVGSLEGAVDLATGAEHHSDYGE